MKKQNLGLISDTCSGSPGRVSLFKEQGIGEMWTWTYDMDTKVKGRFSLADVYVSASQRLRY